jgi:hypothetical protein
MNAFPEKTCSIDRLITHPKLVAATIAGVKTQQRRNGVYGWPGETFISIRAALARTNVR